MRAMAVAITGCLFFIVQTPATAGTLVVDFDFAGSQAILANQTSFPTPVGAGQNGTTAGDLRLTLTGVDETGMAAAPDARFNANLSLLFSISLGSPEAVTGEISFLFAPIDTLLFPLQFPGSGDLVFSGNAGFQSTVRFDCVGDPAACTEISQQIDFTIPADAQLSTGLPLSLIISGLGVEGAATLSGSLVPPVRISGQEITRSFSAPEPGEWGMLLMGIMAVGASGRISRSERRRTEASGDDPTGRVTYP